MVPDTGGRRAGACWEPALTQASHLAPLPTCNECGRAIPPEDPTDQQVDAFVDDDTTRECESCSELWIRLMAQMAARILKERVDA